MNTTGLCQRFEGEGLLQIERGLPLDAHFTSCADCEAAREKYEMLFAALPAARPDAAPPAGWQSRVLREAANREAARPRFASAGLGSSDAWTAIAMIGALAAAMLGFAPKSLPFDVRGETPNSPAPAAPEMALAPAETEFLPTPLLMAPKAPPKQVHAVAPPVLAKTPEPSLPMVLPATPAPIVAEDNVAPIQQKSNKPQVVRPDKLYGFKLDYPGAAMAAKVQGEVRVQCTISAEGKNTNCRVLKSLPFLDQPILRALAAARTDPIRVNGKAVDNSDHIWHITIILREGKEEQTQARGMPIVNWKY